jgi:protein TonB
VLIQAVLLAALLIIPIFTPGVIHPAYSFVPLPPYHGGGLRQSSVTHLSRPTGNHPVSVNPVTLYQPPRIPGQIANPKDIGGGNNLPPIIGIGDGLGNGFGVDFGTGISSLAPSIAPPKPPAPEKPLRVVSTVQEARLVTRIEPIYPAAAIAMHLSGMVRLRAIIASDGTVKSVDIVSGNAILARAAVAAVEQWRYRPTLLSGKAVEVETDITVIFELSH